MARKANNPVIDRSNPALNFLFLSVSSEEEQKTPEREDIARESAESSLKGASILEGYKLVPITETKTRRVQLVMKPSLHKKVKVAVKEENLSFNDYVHRVLEEATADIKVGGKK